MAEKSLPPSGTASPDIGGSAAADAATREAPKRSWFARLFNSSTVSERETTQSRARENMIIAADRFHM